MAEFNIQSESIDVERIMQQVRSRIKEKRGQDYTEAEIRRLANVKLERFLNPRDVRSDLVKHYQQRQNQKDGEPAAYDFDIDTIYRSSRPGLPGRLLFMIRRRLNFILKLFINPVPITDALHEQQQLNRLNFELMNNLVVEMTRLAIEMKNLRMRVESIGGRLDFDERRSRALENVVQYREGDATSARAASDAAAGDGTARSPERKRRRRRRGRRRSSTTPGAAPEATAPETTDPQATESSATEAPSPDSAPAPQPPSQQEGSGPLSEVASPAGEERQATDEADPPKQ